MPRKKENAETIIDPENELMIRKTKELMIRKKSMEERISCFIQTKSASIQDIENKLKYNIETYQESLAYLSDQYLKTIQNLEKQVDNDDLNDQISLSSLSRSSYFAAYALRMAYTKAEEVPLKKQEQICKYVKCSIGFLNDRNLIQFSPMPEEAEAEKIAADKEIIFDIMDIMDMISFSEKYRTIQIQLSRVVLYHISQENKLIKVALSKIPQEKTDYLLNGVLPTTGNEDEKYILASGYTLQELRTISYLTDMSFPEIFTGKSSN